MMHLRHHGRFYISAAVGALVYFAVSRQDPPLRILLAGDVFFSTYLGLMVHFALEVTPDLLRRRASVEDEGWRLIFALTALAVVFGLAATFLILNEPRQSSLVALLAVASVPLSWGMVHTLAAFHYASLFYAPVEARNHAPRDAGGLIFPGAAEPGMLDFFYYSFVIGMTAQVSDVAVSSRRLRLATLVHGIASFFYNAVLIALAVNAGISLAQ